MSLADFREDIETPRTLVSQKEAPPQALPPPKEIHLDYSRSQITPSEDYFCRDRDYPIESYV